MPNFLHIDNLGKPNTPLNTIILLEDFLKSKLIKSSYFVNAINQLRHKNFIVYINAQFFNALTTDWKINCTSLFKLKGFSRQKMQCIGSWTARNCCEERECDKE